MLRCPAKFRRLDEPPAGSSSARELFLSNLSNPACVIDMRAHASLTDSRDPVLLTVILCLLT
jgi:hypothetical protein